MILADMHENVTCKYVEVNSTGKKYIDRQTQESKASVCPLGGARTTPGGHVSSQSDLQLMEEGRALIVLKMY